MKTKATHEGPLKIPMKFDEAIKRALTVTPPSEGWAEYEKKLKKEKRSVRKRRSGSGEAA